MRTLAIINQKGGCGKTTTAINLAGVLAKAGHRTLLVDMDPQSHCAAGLAIPEARIDLDIGDAMLADPPAAFDMRRLLWRASRNLDVAPSRMKLAGLEAPRGGLAEKPGKDRRLVGVLERMAPSYDLCFIDCPPAIGLLTFNALLAADAIIVPVETSYFSLRGAAKQVNLIHRLGRRLGETPPYWLLPTIHDEASPLANDVLAELRRLFTDRVAPGWIRRDATLKEAASFGQPIIEYAPGAPGTEDYTAIAAWLIPALAALGTDRPRAPAPLTAELDDAFMDSDDAVGLADAEICGKPLLEALDGDDEYGPVDAEAGPFPHSHAPVHAAAMFHAEDFAPPDAAVHADAPEAPAGERPSRAADLVLRARKLLQRVTDAGSPIPVAPPSFPTAPDLAPHPLGTSHTRSLELLPDLATEPAASAVRLLGARPTLDGLLFVQPLTAGARLAIAGEFNGWSATTHPMRRNDALAVYELCVPLAPGRHEYRVVADGRWAPDPYNPVSSPNPFGQLNSVAMVPSTPQRSRRSRRPEFDAYTSLVPDRIITE